MSILQTVSNMSSLALQTIARTLDPRPFAEIRTMMEAFEHRSQEVIKQMATGKIRLLPFYSDMDGETPAMRRSYRAMMREPTVRAAIYQIILPSCFLNLEMQPASDHPIDKEAAEFMQWNITRARGGLVALVEATLLGGMIEGYSVAEKVWTEAQHGRWEGSTILKAIKARDTRHYQVEVDEYLNITSIIGTLNNKFWPTTKFVTHRNMPVYDHPAGCSEMKAVYRPAWMLDAVWKLRQAGLQRWSTPYLMGKYPLNQKGVQTALEAQIRQARGDGYVVIPEGASIEALTIASGSQADFAAAVQDLRTEILIGITLAHLQSAEGSTKDGAGDTSIHKEMSELRIWRNAADLAGIIDDQITPQLMEWNYPGRDYPRALFNGVNDTDIKRELEIDEMLQRLGFPLSLAGIVQRTKRQPAADEADTLKPFNGGGVGAGSPMPPPGGVFKTVEPVKAPAPQLMADLGSTVAGKA